MRYQENYSLVMLTNIKNKTFDTMYVPLQYSGNSVYNEIPGIEEFVCYNIRYFVIDKQYKTKEFRYFVMSNFFILSFHCIRTLARISELGVQNTHEFTELGVQLFVIPNVALFLYKIKYGYYWVSNVSNRLSLEKTPGNPSG